MTLIGRRHVRHAQTVTFFFFLSLLPPSVLPLVPAHPWRKVAGGGCPSQLAALPLADGVSMEADPEGGVALRAARLIGSGVGTTWGVAGRRSERTCRRLCPGRTCCWWAEAVFIPDRSHGAALRGEAGCTSNLGRVTWPGQQNGCLWSAGNKQPV